GTDADATGRVSALVPDRDDLPWSLSRRHRLRENTRLKASKAQSAALQHRNADAEIDEQPAEHAVDPGHYIRGLPDSAGRPRREGCNPEAPQRAGGDEDH